MDNFHINVTCEGEEALKIALSLPFRIHRVAVGYSIEDNILTFFWANCDQSVAFPFEMDLEHATQWASAWLKQAKYGPAPDHDGDNIKGWRVFNDARRNWEEFVSIEPAWAIHGK